MNWQDFFHLTVSKSQKGKVELFFETKLTTPDEFAVADLLISRFDHFKLRSIEKKKLSLGLRKIILCHDLFQTQEFKKIGHQFKQKIKLCQEKELTFVTQGGGIYLFLYLLNDKDLRSKKITCYTSELPLPVLGFSKNHHFQFIYRPQNENYLSDFSSLWKESDLMSLFELNDFEASA